MISKVIHEYQFNFAKVKEVFSHFLFELKTYDRHQQEVESQLSQLFSIRFSKNSPRVPPNVLLIGPPGSGRSTQAAELSQKLGVVHVSAKDLLKQELKRCPELSDSVSPWLTQSTHMPEELINQLVQTRLCQPDCRVNGWVLEGFPVTLGQVNLLKAMAVKPTVVV